MGVVTSNSKAQAANIFELTGDIVYQNSKRGFFNIIIDTSISPTVLTSSNPLLLDPLAIDPWYGYDIQSANVVVDSRSWDENDLASNFNEPATGGPTADIWIQGTPIDTEGNLGEFMVIFENSDFIGIGFSTVTGEPPNEANIIINQIVSDAVNFPFGASYQNVNVAKVSEPVPEPLTIFGAGTAIAFGGGFKRKLAKAKKK